MANLMGPPRPNSLIEQILGGQMPYNTPGINPAAPPVNTPSAPTGGANGGFFSQPSFLMNLLAQSGYSTMPQSPLGAIGRAGVATQQQNLAQQQADLRTKVLERQLGVGRDPFQRLNVSDFTTESVGRFQKSGDYADLELRERKSGDPSMVAEWKFFQGLSPEEQRQYLRVKRAPFISNVPGAGVIEADQLDPSESRTVVDEGTIQQGQQARAQSQASGQAVGQARGAQAAKAPVEASFDIAAEAVRDAMTRVDTGGPMGVRGAASGLYDYQDAVSFDNAVQQLSTELRTVFRIPGEGTLSDREQEQYNLQLPSRNFDPANNERILKQLEQRMKARVTTPISLSEDDRSLIDKYLNE